jgi:pimeloyl-ACP methyl ester carboxylesterase
VGSAAGKLTAALSAALLLATITAAVSRAAIAFHPCGQSNAYACGDLTVPLDPSRAGPGTVTLAIRRHRLPVGEARSAVIALAGGPGQAALPITEEFTEILGPILSTRDLIVFDERGTGSSNPLSCHAFETARQFHSPGALIAECAAQLGPARAFYTSLDTVADIEAIRVAGGYEKLVLYGTSYGTKVAELYAEEHPEHVEALVLDSVVTPSGPDPLNRSTFAAIPRVLRALCNEHACAHITAEPVADVARVVRRMHGGSLHGHVIDGQGHAHTVAIDSEDLLGLLLAGDLDPMLRAEFVTAVRAAAERDLAPLARMLSHVESGEETEAVDVPLYYATTCEEEDFPWTRDGSPSVRLAQGRAAIAALPAAALAPFTRADMLRLGDMSACAHWPFATPAAPAVEGSLPDVPTLILSGANDLRTPSANARSVAGQIPDAHLLLVPYAGHSVITDEPTACAREALLAQFAGRSLKPCGTRPVPGVLRPPPLPPARLADVTPTSGYLGRPGRTLHALAITFSDLGRELELQLAEALSSGQLSGLSSLRSGGLRQGWAEYSGGTIDFHGYAYVPGVTISGTLSPEEADLQVGGTAAAHGTLRLARHHRLAGTLGGESVAIGTRALAGTRSAVTVDFGSSLSSAPRSRRLRGKGLLIELERRLEHLSVPLGPA